MGNLEQIIHDLRKVTEKLPYPFELGVTFPLEGQSLENAERLVAQLEQEIVHGEYTSIQEKFRDSEEAFRGIKLTHPYLSVAGRLLEHDLKNHWMALQWTPYYVRQAQHARKKEASFLYPVLFSLLQVKLFCGVIDYLASLGKDESLLLNVPANQMVFVLEGALDHRIYGNMEGLIVGSDVRSDWYVCANELIKNAIAYGHNGDIKVSIDISTQKSSSGHLYQVISIQDNGKGIVDKDGKQLSPKVIREIYREYTTSRSGIGGRAIGSLIDLANENLSEEHIFDVRYNINVITKTPGSDFLYFNRGADVCKLGETTIKNIALPNIYFSPELPSFDHGTVFRLYIPVNEKGIPM